MNMNSSIIIYIICLSYFIFNSNSIFNITNYNNKHNNKNYNNKYHKRNLLENNECKNELNVNYNSRFIKNNTISVNSILTHTNFKLSSIFYHGPLTLYEMSADYLDLLESKLLLDLNFIKCFEPGVILYINTQYLYHFFSEMYDKIMVPFILVSGGACDDSVPETRYISKFMLKDSKIIHWYAQNCGSNPDPNRFTCIPLGINPSQIYDINKISVVEYLLSNHHYLTIDKLYDKNKILKNESYTLLLPSFNMRTHPDRFVVRNIFCNEDHNQAIKAQDSINLLSKINTNSAQITSLCLNHVNNDVMFDITSHSKFVISPFGKGLDCYRTWESLYLGAYVIVKSSSLDEMYKDLPVLIVNSWEDITAELLNAAYLKFSTTTYTYDKLRTSYWYRKFRSYGYNVTDYSFKNNDKYSTSIIEKYNLKDGDLIKGDMGMVYLINETKKHAIPSLEIFTTYWAWDFDKVIHLPEHDLEIIRSGDDVAKCVGGDVDGCNNPK